MIQCLLFMLIFRMSYALDYTDTALSICYEGLPIMQIFEEQAQSIEYFDNQKFYFKTNNLSDTNVVFAIHSLQPPDFKKRLNHNVAPVKNHRLKHLHKTIFWVQTCIKRFSLFADYESSVSETCDLLLNQLASIEQKNYEGGVKYETKEIERQMDSGITKAMRGITEVIWGIYRLTKGDVAGGGILIGDGLLKIVESVTDFKEVNYKQNEARMKREG